MGAAAGDGHRGPSASTPANALQDALYGFDDEADSNTLEVFVSRLRRKLGPRATSRPCAAWATGWRLGDEALTASHPQADPPGAIRWPAA